MQYPRKRNTIETFWSRTHDTGGCILWTGLLNHNGYGLFVWRQPLHGFTKKGGMWMAHRWIWSYLNGPIPKGHGILHSCDTPACVNPKHLRPGDQYDNVHDMLERRGHHHSLRTHCNHGHEFTTENTYWRTNEGGLRRCKTCANAANNKCRAKNKAQRATA